MMLSLLAKAFNAVSRSPRKSIGGRFRSRAVVLDVGCGTMWKSFLYVYLPRKTATVIGFERDAIPMSPYLRSTGAFRLIQCDLDSDCFPLENGSVDAVFFSHVIEHVANPTLVLTEICRVLRPGGTLYIETPGPRSTWMAKSSKLWRENDPYPYNYYDDATHLRKPLTLAELRMQLGKSGFIVQKAGYHREFGLLSWPLYAAIFIAGFLPLLRHQLRAQLWGFGWWNLIGWAIYAVAIKRVAGLPEVQ